MNRIQVTIIKTLQNKTEDITINHIAADVGVDRHTAAKHLAALENLGIVMHRDVGKSKMWKLTPSPLLSIVSSDTPIRKELTNMLGLLDERINIQSKEFEIIWTNKNEEDVTKKCYEIMAHQGEQCTDCPVKKTFATGIQQKLLCNNVEVISEPVKDNTGETIAVINVFKNKTKK
ncbi:winged helix-turn-helix domain-containing protein [Candidatus Woesearchaeota archaeon]|nr:winged helix-turn-helix domain-containing protein [Candidatus Woesearchaeota archaeon]